MCCRSMFTSYDIGQILQQFNNHIGNWLILMCIYLTLAPRLFKLVCLYQIRDGSRNQPAARTPGEMPGVLLNINDVVCSFRTLTIQADKIKLTLA
jgi:hypothetical protein